MKKLLLLLLPVLIFSLTGCDKEKERATRKANRAKQLVGTYNCTRSGYIYMDKIQEGDTVHDLFSRIDYTGKAKITYLGDNRIQLDMGGTFIGRVGEMGEYTCLNCIAFDTYTSSASSELLDISFNIDMEGTINNGNISIRETYSGISQGPSITYITSGSGYTELTR